MKLAPGNSLNPAAMGEALKEAGMGMAEGVALKAAIKAAQPLISPILEKIGLVFGDVEMIFNREITELEDAKEVSSDPMVRASLPRRGMRTSRGRSDGHLADCGGELRLRHAGLSRQDLGV